MKKVNSSISAGVVLLAGLSANAQDISYETTPEVAAEIVKELVEEGQISVDPNGVLKVNKSLFQLLKDKGILTDSIAERSTDTYGGGVKCRTDW